MENFDCNKFCNRAISLFGDVGQVELSQKIGISQGVISAIKNKKAKAPASDTVFRIAKYFNVSADWLLGLTDNQTTDEATKELCTTLGLSDLTIEFLSRKAISPKAKALFELVEHNNVLLEELNIEYDAELSFTRKMINFLVEEQMELVSRIDMENTKDPYSLIALLAIFFDRLRMPKYTSVSSYNGKVLLYNQQGECENDELDFRECEMNMGYNWDIDVKSVLLADIIQKITAYLVDKKNDALKEGANDET